MTAFIREIDLASSRSSLFLFGPRMTGKTYLLKKESCDLFIDLLAVDQELLYRGNPKQLWEELSALPAKSKIIIDEIQKIPELLNYIHKAIEEKRHRFILSGSSARKLKRQGANMLGGRALDYKLWSLSMNEIGTQLDLEKMVVWGGLPKVVECLINKEYQEAGDILRAYSQIYLKEEIQQEALTRNLASFQRFLSVAVQSHSEMIEYSKIARDCSVPASTVKEYYQILEDTLVGFFLWPYDRSERKKARPKFYFFDNGVVRAMRGQLGAKPLPDEMGHLFEAFFINEVLKINAYHRKDLELSLWRFDKYEIDLILSRGNKMFCAYEIKAGKNIHIEPSHRVFMEKFPNVPLSIVSMQDERKRRVGKIDVLPCHLALKQIYSL